VRVGIAPDHENDKKVVHDFDRLLSDDPNVRLFANVSVGDSNAQGFFFVCSVCV
jgi:hypothetical protein